MGEVVPWVLMPTAQAAHVQDTINKWKDQGYKVAIYINGPLKLDNHDMIVGGTQYPGVWNAANLLAFEADRRTDADQPLVCLFAGDDMDPDPRNGGPEIAAQYLDWQPKGGGVMQPCGDPQGPESWESYSKRCPEMAGDLVRLGHAPLMHVPAAMRICGSAWFGREWIRKAHRGFGPTDGRYWHFYADEALAVVATRMNRMMWRPDLAQFHRHWSFGHNKKQDYHDKNQTKWEADKALFEAQLAAGFPGTEFK